MKIEVTSMKPRDSFGMMLVHLSIAVERGRTYDNASVDVFVSATDSVSEIRQAAIASLRKLAQEILDAPAKETADEEE
jgi:hypothetical protein